MKSRSELMPDVLKALVIDEIDHRADEIVAYGAELRAVTLTVKLDKSGAPSLIIWRPDVHRTLRTMRDKV